MKWAFSFKLIQFACWTSLSTATPSPQRSCHTVVLTFVCSWRNRTLETLWLTRLHKHQKGSWYPNSRAVCVQEGRKDEEWALVCFIFKYLLLKASWGQRPYFIPFYFQCLAQCLLYICPINTICMDKWVLNRKPLQCFSTKINRSEGTSHGRQPLCYWLQNLNRKKGLGIGRKDIQLSSSLSTVCLLG